MTFLCKILLICAVGAFQLYPTSIAWSREGAQSAPVDFDALAAKAYPESGEGKEADISALWKAAVRAERWYFASDQRKKPKTPLPLILPVEGKKWIMVFSSYEKAKAYVDKHLDGGMPKLGPVVESAPPEALLKWARVKQKANKADGFSFNQGVVVGWTATIDAADRIFKHFSKKE